MPRGDQRGPEGFGPMTGRGTGYCNGYNQPGFMAFGGGQQFGRGRGGQGQRFGGRFNAGRQRGFGSGGFDFVNNEPPQEQQETFQSLKHHAEFLSNELEMVKNQIQKMEDEKKPE